MRRYELEKEREGSNIYFFIRDMETLDTFEEMTMQYIDYMPRKIAKENDAYFEEEENSLLACMQKGEKHG